jgi:ribonuclease P protein component
MERLKRRQDFVAAAKAIAQPMPAFVMQMRKRDDGEPARLGFTCTKKLGNAVARNRIRRRLKEAARLSMSNVARPGYDYVVIGRPQGETRPFQLLQDDLISATTRLHARAQNFTQTEPR